MYLEYYDASLDEGVCFKCTQIDLVDFRVQLNEGGDWYFIKIRNGDYLMSRRWWPHLGVNHMHWALHKLITHGEALESLVPQ